MEAFNDFGLNWQLVAAEIINFIIIFYILKRYLYPPLFKVLKKRQDLAKESIEQSEKSRKALEKAQAEEKAIIKKAQTAANEILKDARDQSIVLIQEAEETAKKQTQRMIQEAKSQIAIETEEAEKRLSEHVSNLSMEILRKSVSNIFSDEEQSKIIKKAVKEMQTNKQN